MQARQVELVIRRPGHPERRLVLESGEFTIGRAEDNDIVLSEVGVSRRHARILVEPGGVLVEDNGSGNGTLYNGRRFQRQQVADDDEITIDPFTLAFRMRGNPEQAAEVTDGAIATRRLGDTPRFTARLEVVSNHRMAQQVYPLPESGVITLGRSERNGIVLPEPAASRVHAEIGCTSGSFWVRDNGSSNGTWVNARRVKEKVLEDGDRIRIGTVELRFGKDAAEESGDHTENFDSVMFTDSEPPVSRKELVRTGPMATPLRTVVPGVDRSPAARPPARGIHPLAIVALIGGILFFGFAMLVALAAIAYGLSRSLP